MHERIHEHKPNLNKTHVVLSNDGVPESNSTSISFDIISLRFKGCRLIHTVRYGRPDRGGSVPMAEMWAGLIQEMNEAQLHVDAVIMDAPKRAAIKQFMQFNAISGKKP